MQSKTSFFNMALFKKNISRTWIVGLLYFILLMLMLPVSFIINTAHSEDDWMAEMGYTMEMRLYEHMAYQPTASIAIVVAIVVTGVTFWYLFIRRDNYMMHAFPVGRKSLYFTGLLSSMVVAIVPVLLSAIFLTIAAAVSGASGLGCIWYWALIVIVSTCLFMSVAMFSLMTTGQIVTAIIFYFIFNFLYILMEIAFRITVSLLMFGMSSAMDGINYKIWTPVFFIGNNIKVISNVQTDEMGNRVIGFTHEFIGGKYLAIYAVAAVVIILVSYLMYSRKKLETVLDFISVPFMKPIFSVGMSFFISMVAGAYVAGMIEAVKPLRYNARYAIAIVSAIIIGIIIYYATQMLIEKTLRVFRLKNLVHACIYSLAALVVLLGMRFDVVKIENKIPNAKDIVWAGISDHYEMVFTNPDEIEQVRKLHQNFLEDKKELRDVNIIYPNTDGTRYSIRYKLKNGDIIIRNYSVVDTKAPEVSAEYVAATQPILDFINEPTRIKEHVIGNTWNTGEITQMTFSVYKYNDNFLDYEYQANSFDELSTNEKKEKYGRVYQALLKDVDAGKVFVQSFNGYDGYEYDKKALYNDFDFTITDKEHPYFSDTEHFWDYADDYFNSYPRYEQNITVSLNKNCDNTLKALKEEGFYESDDDILTYEEYDSQTGGDGGEPIHLYND